MELLTPMTPGLLAVRAEAETGDDAVLAAITDLRADIEGRLLEVEKHQNLQAVLDASSRLNGLGGGGVRAVDPEYTAQFSDYFRTGHGEKEIQAAQRAGDRGEIVAAMQTGSESDGGYLAPTEWDRRILSAQLASSPMRRLCNVQKTTVGEYKTVWSNDQWGSGWVGETAARPQTTTPTLSAVIFGHGEIYANAPITQRLLDDAAFDLEGWLATSVEGEFSRQEGPAFLAGDGVNKPFGFLTYVTGAPNAAKHPGGAIKVYNSGKADGLTTDGLIDFVYKLPSTYRQGAVWLMNSTTAAMLSKLKDLAAFPIWREGLAQGQPSTLLGWPVEIDENMPNPTAGGNAIAFGNFKIGYAINDRFGIRILRDPYTAKPFVNFYCTKRVGGGVADPNAIQVMKIAA
jgi:HK97 family phage major capsid protein